MPVHITPLTPLACGGPSPRDARGLAVRILVRVLLYRFARHAIPAVDPPSKILKLAALAAEGNPGCLGELAPAKHADTSRHGSFY